MTTTVNFWTIALATLAILPFGNPVKAGEADVLKAEATQAADGSWTFSVTVQHADAGWEHYADAWVVLTLDEKKLGERILLHPHDLEQPFTRSASGIDIPDDVQTVIIRARDSVHEFGGEELRLDLPRQ